MQKLPAAAPDMHPGCPTGNLLGPGLPAGCHSPQDLLFGCGLAGMVKVMVGPLPDINQHCHNAFLLRQSVLRAGARHSGYLLLCSAAHPFLPPKSLSFPCTIPLSGEEVSLCLVLDGGWLYQTAKAYPGLGYNIWDITYKHH